MGMQCMEGMVGLHLLNKVVFFLIFQTVCFLCFLAFPRCFCVELTISFYGYIYNLLMENEKAWFV